jgi:hypothetical protein
MKALAILGTALAATLLVLVADPDAPANTDPQKGKENKGKESRTTVITHTPAIGGGAKPPAVVKTPVVNPTTPTIVNRTPVIVAQPKKQVVVQPVKPVVPDKLPKFVDKNLPKFVGPGQKEPVVKVVDRPKINDKIGDKVATHVIEGYHKNLGGGPIKVGGKTVELRRRDDLVNRFHDNYQGRFDKRVERADVVRRDLGRRYEHLFVPHWWDHHRDVHVGWWNRWPAFARAWYDNYLLRHDWGWWRPATWVNFTAWCFPTVWGPPLYYDYGGNVIFENNVVYVEGMPVASEQDYASQALALAARGADLLAKDPPSPDNIEQAWMPLGVFGLCNQQQGDPAMFVQLAVRKDGAIAGTYTNDVTGEALPVTGAIDPYTQRAAWFIGDNKDTVFETGTYNLTLPESQVLVHFGLERTQTWFMVRMPEPEE